MVLVREKSGQFSRTSGAGEDHAPSRAPAGIPSGHTTTDFCCGGIDALKVSRGGTATGSENRPRPLFLTSTQAPLVAVKAVTRYRSSLIRQLVSRDPLLETDHLPPRTRPLFQVGNRPTSARS
jgi:hypothetical protein